MAIKWLSAPPPVLQRPFQRDRPLPQGKYDAGYARLFMMSSGGRCMTKFSSTHIFKGRIKHIMQQSNCYQMAFGAAPRPPARSRRIWRRRRRQRGGARTA